MSPAAIRMISDARYTRRHLHSFAVQPDAVSSLRATGLLDNADIVRERADTIGIGLDRLITTIRRFNGSARTGSDQAHRSEALRCA